MLLFVLSSWFYSFAFIMKPMSRLYINMVVSSSLTAMPSKFPSKVSSRIGCPSQSNKKVIDPEINHLNYIITVRIMVTKKDL